MPVVLEHAPLTKEIVLAHIPAFPPVVLKVLDLVANEGTDTAILVRELSADATLSGQILRLANSPLFGLAAQVDTVHHAVVTLGFARVQSLVMSVATTNYMKGAMRTEALQKCWRHTLASAVLCRELARAAALQPDRAYSFGLLHDLGRLGLLVAYPAEYESLLKTADRDAVSLLDLEKKRFGLDHCEAGRQLVEQWKLPPEFCVIAGRHHDSISGSPLDYLTLVHTACRLADCFGYAVVTPLKPASLEEILALLPAVPRESLAADRDRLAEVLAHAVDPGQPLPEASLGERVTALREHAAPAPVKPADVHEEPALFGSPETAPSAWRLPVIILTLLLLLGGAAALWFLINR